MAEVGAVHVCAVVEFEGALEVLVGGEEIGWFGVVPVCEMGVIAHMGMSISKPVVLGKIWGVEMPKPSVILPP